LLSDDLKNKLYYDGFQKMLYHYSHQRASSFGLRLFFFVLAFKLFIALPKAER